METKTITKEQAEKYEPCPSKNARELYALLRQDFKTGNATEVHFGSKNQWARLKDHLVDLAEADGLEVYQLRTSKQTIKKIWLEPKSA